MATISHDTRLETLAQAIYARMPGPGTGEKPAWVPGGDALEQNEARDYARAVLASIGAGGETLMWADDVRAMFHGGHALDRCLRDLLAHIDASSLEAELSGRIETALRDSPWRERDASDAGESPVVELVRLRAENAIIRGLLDRTDARGVDAGKLAFAHETLATRYRDLIVRTRAARDPDASESGPAETRLDHLHWMCETILANLDVFPGDKSSRWLGYVQGCLVAKGLLDVTAERDASRPLFHAAYGERAPASVSRAPSATNP